MIIFFFPKIIKTLQKLSGMHKRGNTIMFFRTIVFLTLSTSSPAILSTYQNKKYATNEDYTYMVTPVVTICVINRLVLLFMLKLKPSFYYTGAQPLCFQGFMPPSPSPTSISETNKLHMNQKFYDFYDVCYNFWTIQGCFSFFLTT